MCAKIGGKILFRIQVNQSIHECIRLCKSEKSAEYHVTNNIEKCKGHSEVDWTIKASFISYEKSSQEFDTGGEEAALDSDGMCFPGRKRK